MYTIGKESKWDFVTSVTAGGSYGIGAAEGGKLMFVSPTPDDTALTLYYGSIGAGVSVGLKFPSLSLSGRAMPSWGKLYMSDTFSGDELQRSDLTGPCYFFEVGAGLLLGGSGTIMVLGVSWAKMGFKLSTVLYPAAFGILGEIVDDTGVLDDELDMHVNAILFFGGQNAGNQVGAGAVGYAGLVV